MSDNKPPKMNCDCSNPNNPYECGFPDCVNITLETALEKWYGLSRDYETLTAKIKELEAEREWVSVDDRLPNHGDLVVCYYSDAMYSGHCLSRFYNFNLNMGGFRYFKTQNNHKVENVTHWMSLPQSPKGFTE